MEYPIHENGREIGRLYARQEGLYTVFEARLPARAGLTRLYLCGKGECRLLGLMEPGGGGLCLCRRLSRRELPRIIEYAATAPDAPPAQNKGAQAAESRKKGSSAAPQDDREAWEQGANGMLYNRRARLLAIPARLRRGRAQAQTMVLNGKEYIVFHW